MCDCNDEINNGSIPIGPTGPAGPTGPTGPTGPRYVIGASSETALSVGTGLKNLTITDNSGIIDNQLVRIANAGSTQVMVGTVTSVVGTALTVDVLYVEGTGIGLAWTISSTGSKGDTGATGATGAAGSTGAAGASAYTVLTANATPLGGTVYQIDIADSTWMSEGQTIYIQDAGYYTVTSITSATRIIINNLEYTGNNTANLLDTKTLSAAGIIGLSGTNGTNGVDGFNYETVDGNGIPAEATGAYQILMRNSTNTGYQFISAAEYKIILSIS